MPHNAGKRYSDYVVNWDDWEKSDKGAPLRASRVVAVRILDNDWEAFRHLGNVPGTSERLEYQCSMGLQSMFPTHPSVAACPKGVGAMQSDHGISHTRRWLIDSGSGWDLVKASNVSHLYDLIRTPHYCPRLWTANGVTKVHQEVPLFIPELNENCVPFVLKNTPDVLTMRRRCMCDGYSFVWRAKSSKPYFRRPDGTRIYLIVDH